METSLADMKAGFPLAPEPIQVIPTLESLIELLFHMCRCTQTHRSPASNTMNLLFCACPSPIYGFFTADAYPDAFAPIPPAVDKVLDYTNCRDENDRATTRAKHALNRKTRADIITMNGALTNVFLDAVWVRVRGAFQQWRLRKSTIVFVDMFEWFAQHYGTMTADDRDANCQRMAANWHPGNNFDALTLRLFTSTAYANATGYPIVDCDIVGIGIRVIKRCGLYVEEYKSWIARVTTTPRIVDAVWVRVRVAFQQWRLRKPTIVFVDMFEWFAQHSGATTADDCNANRQRMAADWHPGNNFDALTLRLFTSTAYANATGYPIVDWDIVNIGIRIIKQCGLYAEEYKSWIARATTTPRIVETLNTFKKFWVDKIMLVNQTAISASLHGYGMAVVNNNNTVVLYSESIANFGAAYAATQESVKTQDTTMASMQTQL
jgi:hypothetical protein